MPAYPRLDDNEPLPVNEHTENNVKLEPDIFCFGHGVGAHVCGIAGISEERLKEMNVHAHPKVCFRQ